MRVVRAAALLAFSGAVGATLGTLAYAGIATLTLGGDYAAHVLAASAERRAFAIAGAALGFAVGGEALGLVRLRAGFRLAGGVLAGALAGFLLYAIGYTLGKRPGWPPEPLDALYVLEAWYSFTPAEALAVGLGAAVGFLTVRYTWRFQGILTYVSLVATVVGYLLYVTSVTLPRVPPSALWISIPLFVAEAASLAMVVVYAFYALDIFVKKRWRRSADKVPFSRYYVPKVAFHVTVMNEPFPMVRDTLRSLLDVEYPRDRFVVMVLDDSTRPELCEPLEQFCRENGVTFVHRETRRGFKAGALNVGLAETPADVDLIAVVDADYRVEKEYLRETVGYFINPNLGFLQTPQDYRNRDQSFLTEQYYYADSYFYRAILPSRNEENTIIFCGTMGIIRRSTLEAVGGWGERYISEDAELSARVLEAGYDSLYVNKTYGRGLIPATFEGLKRQHKRWSFGGTKILKGHFFRFFFSRLSLRQKFDFLVGGLHWFDGVWIMIIAGVLATLAIGDLLGLPFVTHHEGEVWLVGLVPLFLLVDGLVRLKVALRRSMGLGFFATVRVMGLWFAIKFNNTFAALLALAGVRLGFERTPKSPDARPGFLSALGRALALTKFETSAFLLLAALGALSFAKLPGEWGRPGYLGRLALAVWLSYYALIFLAAPLYAYKSYATFVPDEEIEARDARGRAAGGRA